MPNKAESFLKKDISVILNYKSIPVFLKIGIKIVSGAFISIFLGGIILLINRSGRIGFGRFSASKHSDYIWKNEDPIVFYIIIFILSLSVLYFIFVTIRSCIKDLKKQHKPPRPLKTEAATTTNN